MYKFIDLYEAQLKRWGVYIISIPLFLMAAIEAMNVIGRKLYVPFPCAIESVESLLVITIYFGVSIVALERGHVKVDLLLDRLVPNHRSALECIMSFVGAIVCLIVAGIGVLVTLDHLQRGVRTSTDLSIPWAPLLAVIPIGVLALSVQLFLKALASLKKIK